MPAQITTIDDGGHHGSIDLTSPSVTPLNLEITDEATPSGLYIPIDVLRNLFTFLDKPELAACSRVSWDTHLLVLPLLYNTLEIDLAKPFNPMTILGQTIEELTQPLRDTNLRSQRMPLPNRFDSVTRLAITPHRPDTCRSIPYLVLPHLETLVILPGVESAAYRGGELEYCSALHHLNPTTMITTSGFDGHDPHSIYGDRWLFSRNQPQLLKAFVLLLQPTIYGHVDDGGSSSDIPSTVDRLTILFGNEWGNFNDFPKLSVSEQRYLWNARKVKAQNSLTWALLGKAKVQEIVGLETLRCPYLSEGDVSFRVTPGEIRDELARILTMKNWSAAEAKQRAANLVFTDKKTYMERNDKAGMGSVVGWITAEKFLTPYLD